MKKIKSILAILATVMAVSIAYAQENTAEVVPQQQASASQEAQTSSIDTKYGKVKITKRVSADSSTVVVGLDSVPENADVRDLVSTLYAIAAKTVDPVHAAAIQAMASAINTKSFADASGKPGSLTVTIPNAGKPDMSLNLGSSTARFTPEVVSDETGSTVKGSLAITDAAGATTSSSVELKVPADGSNITGNVDNALVVVPQKNTVTPPDTAKAEAPTAENTQASTPDTSVNVGKGEVSPVK